MIDREQLATALGRLDPRQREVLDYSLRRRVPDADLDRLLSGSPGDVARLRAAAVEALSGELGVERGDELGDMLKQLLEPATWALVARGQDIGHEPAGHRPARAGPPPAEPPRASTAPRVLAGIGAAILVLVPVGVVAALGGGRGGGVPDAGSGPPAPDTRVFAPEQAEASGEPFPTDPQSAFEYPVARTAGKTALFDEPGGKVKARIAGETDWSSPRVLGVVDQRDEWLAVLAPELRNGEVGWVRRADLTSLETVSWSVHADLSKRLLVVRRGARAVRRFRIGVGREGHSTPTGRFAVTDKLRVSDEGSPYGCCVVALTGHQTRLPDGWPGGDRLAVHATSDTSGLGKAVSLGCMRSDPKDARWLMEAVPLGTPVFIRG